MHKFDFCQYISKRKWAVGRHMRLTHKTNGVSGGGFNGFDIGNAKSFNHNGAVNMGIPSHISNISSNMDGKFDGNDIGNTNSFNHNVVVNMGAPSHISNISSNMDQKFDIRPKEI